MKFGMFYFAEYMEVATSAMLLVTIFLGGWHLPFLHRDGLTIAFGDTELFAHAACRTSGWCIIGVLAFFGKTIVLCWVQIFIRWTLPRFRYDQLMKLGWTVLLPASLANILVTGIVVARAPARRRRTRAARSRSPADVTQGFVARRASPALVVWAVVGFVRTPRRATSDRRLERASSRPPRAAPKEPSPMQA